MDLNYYFDEAKKLLDIDKDAVLARQIGIRPQELNRARQEGQVKAEVLLKMAEMAGMDVEKLLIAREVSKAKEPATKAAWNRILTKGVAAMILTGISVNQITPSLSQVHDFPSETSSKDYRKFRGRFKFSQLAVEISNIFGTVSRLIPRQPIPLFR